MPGGGQVFTPGAPMPGGPTMAVAKAGGSTAAMVLGIIGLVLCPILILSILAIIFGLRARKKIKASGGQLGGKGQATAGLVTGIIGLLMGAGVIAIAAFADSTSLSSTKVGDCVEVPKSEGLIFSIKGQDCDKPHEGEIVGVGELNGAGDKPYPGDGEALQLAGDACSEKFEAYVGEPADGSDLALYPIYPSKSAWNGGDGQYLCIALDPTGDLTESVKG